MLPLHHCGLSTNVCHMNQMGNEKWASAAALTHLVQRYDRVAPSDLVEDKCTTMRLRGPQRLLRAFLDANRLFGGIAALASLEIEFPPVQRAHKVVAVDLAEHRQVGIAVRAAALHHVVTDCDV